jgi:hypothetical protein
MTEIRRITAAKVRAAVAATGAQLVRGLTFTRSPDGIVGCPIGLCGAAAGAPQQPGGRPDTIQILLHEAAGDGRIPTVTWPEAYQFGFADGAAVAAALLGVGRETAS